MNDITEINNQVEQIKQLESQLSSINGQRLLGRVDNDPRLRNYVPANAYTFVNAIDTNGYGGLTRTLPGKPGTAVPAQGPAPGRHERGVGPSGADQCTHGPDRRDG
jgi:hypothetical protein